MPATASTAASRARARGSSGCGRSSDFPDAGAVIAPFPGRQNALGTSYPAPRIVQVLLPGSRRERDRAAVVKQQEQAQQVLVDDVRLLPLWQGGRYVAAGDDISGGARSTRRRSRPCGSCTARRAGSQGVAGGAGALSVVACSFGEQEVTAHREDVT